MVLSDDGRGWRKYVIAGWAFLECLLFAGTLYGWSSLVFVLKDEGIYSYLCVSVLADNTTYTEHDLYMYNRPLSSTNDTNSVHAATSITALVALNDSTTITRNNTFRDVSSHDASCKEQDIAMNLCFTVSSAIFCASCYVMGQLNYKVGTRATRIVAFFIFIAGTLCLAFLSKATPWLMYPGLTLIGVGGLPLLVTNTQVSNLFTKGSSSVVGLLCGGYDMSSAVFLVIKLAYQRGVSRRAMYAGLAVLHGISMISTWFFLPVRFIARRPQDLSATEIRLHNFSERSNEARRHSMKRPSLVEVQSLRSYLKQPLFITHNVWLCLLQLRFYYLIGTLNPYLNRVLGGDKQLVSYYTDVCFYTMMGGLVTSFLAGIVYDWQRRVFAGRQYSGLYRGLMPAVLPLSLASLLSITFSVLVLIPIQPLLYVTFAMMTLCRSFLYSMAAAFISAIFPSEFFGLLYGITMVMAGVFGCLQYAFFHWAESYDAGATHADIGLLCVAIVSLGHPIYMWVCARREEKEYKASLQ